jgi:dTDP-4-dehydrorhamnose 3,5-epimerase
MHFQIEPFAEEKLITCVQGSIFDVIIDLRPKSKTFGKWTSFNLSASNSTQIYIPKGMAHGFQTLMPDSIVLYSISNRYIPESAYSIDPLGDININWPLGITAISDRDSGGLSTSIAAQMYADSLTS